MRTPCPTEFRLRGWSRHWSSRAASSRRGKLDSSGLDGPLPPLGTVAFLVLARGYLCLAEGDAAAAKVEFSEVRKIAPESLYLNPSALAWRSGFALALSEDGSARGRAATRHERRGAGA